MTATTISAPAPAAVSRSTVRLVVAAVIVLLLLGAAFVSGRISAPTHTVHSVVTVPSSAPSGPSQLDDCRLGRAC